MNGANRSVVDLFRKMRDAARLAGLVAFLRLLLLLALVNPTAATDRTLCFQLPGELRPRPGARRAATYPNSTADRCVTRALWDIQAASMHRVRGADDAGADATALRCVPAQEAFLCDRRLGDPNELFVCQLTDAGPGSTLTTAMDACVWPVCEQICASAPPGGTKRADDWEMTRACRRCERACDTQGFKPQTSSAGQNQNSPGRRYCAGVAAAAGSGGDAETRARAAYAYALGGWTGGWSGISAAATGAGAAASTAAATAAASTAASAAATTTAAAAASTAAASTAAVATTAALTGNFFVVSARVALLFVAFKSVLQHFIVVAPPGFGWNPVPNRPGGHPNPGGPHPGWPPIPPAPTWKAPPPYSWAPSPPPATFTKPPPPPATSTSPPPPPAPTPGGQCPGVADPAFTCVGECGLCIYFPGEEDPNCCCDADCSSFGDCCGDFDACCPAGTFAAKHAFDASALGKKSVFSGARRGSSFGGVRTVSGSPFDGVRTVSGSPSGATGRDARPRTAGDEAAQLSTRGATVGTRRAKEGGHARVAARSARILDLD